MLTKPKFLSVVFSLSLILSVCIVALADTIKLKDGSVIKGKIVNFRDQQFVILIGDGTRQRQMTFFAGEIEAIEFDAGIAVTSSNVSNPVNSTTVLPRPSASPETRPDVQNTANNNANNNITSNTVKPNPTPPITTPPVQSNTNRTNTGQNTASQTNTPPVNTNAANTNVSGATARPKPIQLNVRVLADSTSNGWTNSGWVVRKGQKIRIIGRGQVNLGNGNVSRPEGVKSLADQNKLIKTESTGGLIAVIGDDNNEFIFIGAGREFTAARDGALFLGVNEGVLDDNSGSFDVTVEIDPAAN